MAKDITSKRRTILNTKNTNILVAGGLIAVVVTLLATHVLAISAAVIEPENGSRTGQASIWPDTLASGGSSVQYTATSSGTVTIPTNGTWANITGNLSGHSASCGSVGGLIPVPGSNAMLVGVGQYNMFKSTAGNATWTELGTGSGSVKVENRPDQIIFDPTNPNIFWEGGSWGPGVYKTTDGGATFKELGSGLRHVDGIAVDLSDPARKLMLAGAHEESQKIYKSTDGGATWTNIGAGLPGGYSNYPYIVNPTTYFVVTTPGIYRTTNGGSSWTKVSSAYATGAPVTLPNGTIVYTGDSSTVRSSDNGLTWTSGAGGLFRDTLVSGLPDGKLVTATGNNRLAYSTNQGASWTEFGPVMSFFNTFGVASGSVAGVAYSPANDAFYAYHWDCGDSVGSDSIWRLNK